MERRAGAGSWRAHPRSRGENISDRRGEHSRPGSSPLARGKLEGRLAALSGQRLIPARAGKTLAIGTKTPTHPAHPRSRGENNLSEDDSSFWRGSSPLARGKLRRLPSSSLRSGLIPARAGKTIRPQTSSPKAAAHPRSRGENRSARDTGGSSQGSSPLARGKLLACAAGVLWRGLIPARAGKTGALLYLLRRSTAHPRSRGENSVADVVTGLAPGSSPLARGKSSAHSGTPPASSAHPRSRGENLLAHHDGVFLEGSSPLARGKPCVHLGRSANRRLIPARAGKTWCGRTWGQRLCGSSPLARGKPRRRRAGRPQRGLIPARAGKTCQCCSRCSQRPAHPRSRGENPSAVCAFTVRVGSSPLARGKPRGLASTSAHYGLIPARAGKTTPCPHGPRRPAAHPRSRGENCSGHGSVDLYPGSSPLARGKPHCLGSASG